jgi:hypothetical protein
MDMANVFGKYPLVSYHGKLLINKPVVIVGTGPSPLRFSPPRYGISSIQYGQFGSNALDGGLAMPYWLFIGLVVAATVAPWLPQRFTLRTLLIATTLVALVLGLIVWLR